MIILQRITFRPRKGEADWVFGNVRTLADQMLVGGYILGTSMGVHQNADGTGVSLTAYFTGRGAWRAVTRDTRDGVRTDLETIAKATLGEPIVEVLRRPGSVPAPSCRCKRTSKPPLDLWCTPHTEAPPLLCSLGGIIEYYRLPIPDRLLGDLNRWNIETRAIGSLYLNLDSDFKRPSFRWAERHLNDPNSAVNLEAKRLAKALTKHVHRKVLTHCPPVHLMRA